MIRLPGPGHRRLHDDAGQSTLEWLGVAAVTVAIVLALVLAAPGLGQTIQRSYQCLVSSLVGDGAACGAGQDASGPEEPCVVRSQGGDVAASGRIAIVDIESGDAYVREEKSDGTVEVTFIDEGSLGVSGRLGGGIEGNVGGVGGGGRAEVTIGGAIEGFIGETRIFDDPDDADRFIRDRITDEAIDALPLPLEVPATLGRGLVDLITGHETPTGRDGSTQGGVGISGEAAVEGAVGPLRGQLEGSAEQGAEVKLLPDGSAEVTIQAGSEIGGSLRLIAGVEGNAAGSQSITVTVDPDGRPVKVSIQQTVEGDVGVGLNVVEDLSGLDLPIAADTGRRSQITVSLDLTDPALGPAARDLVDEIGSRLRGDGSLDDVLTATDELVEAVERAGTATVTVYDIDGLDAGVEGSANIGVGLGAGVTIATDTADLISAHHYDPLSNRFVPWISCTG